MKRLVTKLKFYISHCNFTQNIYKKKHFQNTRTFSLDVSNDQIDTRVKTKETKIIKSH